MSKTKQLSPLEEKEIYEDVKKLVIARIKASSDELRISLGSHEYTKEEILKNVEEGSELGREFIDIQMEYLRDMAEGAITNRLMSNAILIKAGNDEGLLMKKIVYARSCDAANNLGQKCIKTGTLAFIGYKKKYAIGYSPSKITDSLRDEVARLFIEPSNLVPISLLKGNTVKDAYRKSQDAMWRNFRFMLSTRASQSQKDAAPYLWFNRKYQVALGNQDAQM